ncbi:FAD-dependent oxidoreductase [Halovulum sp. GXIMD14793]
MRVGVIGAGPTGLTAALELRRRGVDAQVFEQRATPSQLSRAVGIQPKSLGLLHPSGAAADILTEAIRFQGVVFHRGSRQLTRLPFPEDDKATIYGLAQDRTEHHLAAALQRYGGHVRFGAAFEGLRQSDDSVTARIDGQELTFDYLIGADGVRSTVRAALGLEYPGFDLPEKWSIADVDSDDWPHPGWFCGYQLAGGNIAVVVPLEKARYRVIASQPDALAALPVPMLVRNIRRSGAFTISVRQVAQYRQGRVFLAGDAAHCHSPVGGRGMNLGIADATDLAARLVDGDLDGYHAARHPEGARVLRFSERGRKIIQSATPFARTATYTALRATSLFPPLGRAALRRLVDG